MNLSKILLFHFTNIDNLSLIVKHGLRCDSLLDDVNYINSGDMEIKQRRLHKPVPFGGHVGDYVPFYFAPRSPMLYRQFLQNNIDQKNIVYLVTNAEKLINNGYIWCCSDMNAAKDAACFYNTISDMLEYIDWNLMKEMYWHNTDTFPDRKERRMAEFLVRGAVQILDFLTIATYDDATAQRLRASLPPDCQWEIVRKQNWYF